ncbi:NAD(P)-dependent dehydrogenase (short-subunit alcohol dehydrogenase family) [Microbacterium phyllosphaerae]|uniref:NAD(P)-dependent dehydrogenase (Short-subunit alcohol dehydrogenase family) n=1 Tax=Microbacterium phyllosphaerae TaxID=124798 RepID=A0ABS4WLA1_9MICO|nr:SDR family NAD(P)-dependent oxidoreductase [Microbacterium phyllosphaerae]MBP2376975.1 NAD(P)-dependent dehydrogenase (short-subunit alcohol dehydrogenase family) [Microbacterium phyllosphaerae]
MTNTSTPVVLVTGTSTGIGLSTAVALAGAGWTTIATMRDLGKADALRSAASEAGVALDIRSLDVTDHDDVISTIDAVIAEHGHLDAVINNAGAGALGTIEAMGLDRVRAAMEVNFFGVVDVTKTALPHLRASRGRLVTVTSVGGVVGQPFNEVYCAAKFAVEGFMESLHPVMKNLGVAVSVVEPGPVMTEFVANSDADREALVTGADDDYLPAIDSYLARTRQAFAPGNAQTPDDVAAVILSTLTSDDPAFRVQTSAAATAFTAIKLADLDGSAVTGLTAGWVATA